MQRWIGLGIGEPVVGYVDELLGRYVPAEEPGWTAGRLDARLPARRERPVPAAVLSRRRHHPYCDVQTLTRARALLSLTSM